MNKYRSAAFGLAACAAVVTLAACSAGASTTSSAATSAAASSRSASASASARASSPGRTVSAGTVAVGGSIGTFPIPAGADIAENVSISHGIDVIFSLITPAKVSSFYATALPRSGYVISGNELVSVSGGTEVLIQFSGHGYKGDIAALSNFTGAGGVNIAGLGHKNVTTISLQPA